MRGDETSDRLWISIDTNDPITHPKSFSDLEGVTTPAKRAIDDHQRVAFKRLGVQTTEPLVENRFEENWDVDRRHRKRKGRSGKTP